MLKRAKIIIGTIVALIVALGWIGCALDERRAPAESRGANVYASVAKATSPAAEITPVVAATRKIPTAQTVVLPVAQPEEDKQSVTVYITKTGEKYCNDVLKELKEYQTWIH